MQFFKQFFYFTVFLFVNGQDTSEEDELPEGRIVGGNEIPISEAPYQAVLLINNHVYCGGSIIDKTWILTAAHCTPKLNLDTLTIRVGSADSQSGGQLLQGVQIIVHPKFNFTTLDNDAALIQVNTEITTGEVIPLTKVEPRAGTDVWASGWGTFFYGAHESTTQLRQVELNIVGRTNCQKAYTQTITRTMICAASPGKDTCQGDSGGPLTTTQSLVGIVSAGKGCANSKYPGIYTNIADASITNFIKQYIPLIN